MKPYSKLVALTLFSLLSFSAAAEVIPAEGIFSDHMVLQRNTTVAIWGKADGKVTIKTSWSDRTVVAKTDKNGRWMASVPTSEAGGPYEITLSDGKGSDCVIKDVLLGEVWFCSGQSNMVMPMKGFEGQPVEGAIEKVLAAKPSRNIRMFNVGRQALPEPAEKLKSGMWKLNTPENVGSCSAVAYMFADYLENFLEVPVGIVTCAWGGSLICAWMDDAPLKGTVKKQLHHSPSYLYNGMVAPLIPFTFAGEIWYQGESDRDKNDPFGAAERYQENFGKYVAETRAKFRNPDMPVYFVQIAPYKYSDAKGISGSAIREAQEKCLDSVPGCWMATTLDVGEEKVIHPAVKRPVARRLAMLALEKTYGVKGLYAEAPRLSGFKVEDNVAVLEFSNAKMGLNPISRDLSGFEIAGEDRVFHPAKAQVGKNRSSVKVSCDEVPAPVAVRYCFHNYAVGSLFNCYGTPVPPFRTDNWNDVK